MKYGDFRTCRFENFFLFQPMMDRQKQNELPKMQVGFINFICLPLYEVSHVPGQCFINPNPSLLLPFFRLSTNSGNPWRPYLTDACRIVTIGRSYLKVSPNFAIFVFLFSNAALLCLRLSVFSLLFTKHVCLHGDWSIVHVSVVLSQFLSLSLSLRSFSSRSECHYRVVLCLPQPPELWRSSISGDPPNVVSS